jgi:cellulose synthase operon protein YhjQ
MQVISFISGKGGVGKTTIAANTAMALARRGKRVVVVDLDPQNTLRLHFGMDPLDSAGLVREGVSSQSVFNSAFGVQFIPFGRVLDAELNEFEAALKANPRWIRDGIERLNADTLDFVILDTPPGPSVFLQQALHASDRTLAVVLADAASFVTVSRLLELVGYYTSTEPAFRGVNILINQMPDTGLGQQVRTALYEQYAGRMVPLSISRDPAVSEALAFERPVLQYEPGCRASQDIESFVSWMLASDAG